MQRTLVILKPDAMHRRMIGRIIQRFEDKGLKPVAMMKLHAQYRELFAQEASR